MKEKQKNLDCCLTFIFSSSILFSSVKRNREHKDAFKKSLESYGYKALRVFFHMLIMPWNV